jgi:hypothetical protein
VLGFSAAQYLENPRKFTRKCVILKLKFAAGCR